MNKNKNHSAIPILISLVIAFCWFFITFMLSMEYAGFLDSIEIHVPLWLRLSTAIVWFPLNCFVDLEKNPGGLSGHMADLYSLFLCVLNSLVWGFLLVALFQRATRIFCVMKISKPTV